MCSCAPKRYLSLAPPQRSINFPLLLLMQVLATRPCYHVWRSFPATVAWSPSPTGSKSLIRKTPSPSPFTKPHSSDHSVRIQTLIAHEERHGSISCWSNTAVGSSYCNSRLFSQGTTRNARGSSVLPMVADDASGDEVSEKDKRPLAEVWVCFRKLMVRLWTLLLKPFRLLKSPLKKDDKGTHLEEDTNGHDESIQEWLSITGVGNMTTQKDDDKEYVESIETEEDMHENEPIQHELALMSVGTVETVEDIDRIAHVAKGKQKILNESDIEQGATDASFTKSIQARTCLEPKSPCPRQATSSANVDLTGNWTLIVDEYFTAQYDEYLRKLGQPMLVRTVALTVIGSTKEETIQTMEGNKLFIRGMNVRGSWERILEASEQIVEDGREGEKKRHTVEGHALKPMLTADGEDVVVASWWEENGTVHHSWVVGGKKYGGGDFENKRYLTDNGNILVCESTFHPMEEGREKACVTWRFLREGAIYGDVLVQLPNIFEVLKMDEKATKGHGDEDGAIPRPDVAGNILGDFATSEKADYGLLSTFGNNNTPNVNLDTIDEAIECEGWNPPDGGRWAISAPDVDLSGKWKLIITEQYKKDYDVFLRSLGQPMIVRAAAVVLVGNTREETKQIDGGRTLYIKGINAKGIWERTLTSSGSDYDTTMVPSADGSYKHLRVPVMTADSERVVAESWWEFNGTVHVSWTHGVKRYGGGSFESRRYLENNGNVYVCESTFHPDDDQGREESFLKWKFLREGAACMLSDQ